MRKKLMFVLVAVCALSCGAAVFTACASDEVPVHNHRYIEHEAVAATCVSEGNVAYQECPYCGEYFIDGNKVERSDIVIEIDNTNHTLSDVASQAAKCVEAGLLAHQECDDCHKLFLNGTEVQQADVTVAPRGSHAYSAGALNCSDCDGYKLLFNGEYIEIDGSNKKKLVTNPRGASYAAGSKAGYLTASLTNRITLGTQVATGTTAANRGDYWEISSPDASRQLSCFTRFAYGNGDEAYVGKFLMVFDASVTTETQVQRIGVKLVDSVDAAVISSVECSKLLGTNSSEENNPNRKLEVGVTYRFAYEIELTEVDQIVQIFTVFDKGIQTVKLSNLHFVNLEEKTGNAHVMLINFADATAPLTKFEECGHAWQYAINDTKATCLTEGYLAHDYCPQCGARTKDGEPATDLILPKVDHDYGELHETTQSTCEVKGHDAYYQCSWCKSYFDSEKTKIEQINEYDLLDHTGVWQHTVEKHWLSCTLCNKDVNEGAHVPGAEATDTTAQKCTVCGRVITPALSHVHTPGALVPQKAPSCTENGNPAYYQCTDPDCGKYFSDKQCTVEIQASDISIDATGHTMADKVEAKPVTCTEDGNLEYYYCSICKKYFADNEGLTDITDTYFLKKLGHKMTHHTKVEQATCAERVHDAYYSCSNCNKLYQDADGETVLDNVAFTGEKIAHNFNEGVCSVCGAKEVAHTITIKSGATGNNSAGSTIKSTIVSNPGTWGVQYNDNNTKVDIEGGALKIEVPNNKSQRAAFVRVIPANADNTAFVGAYRISFDFKLTKSGDNTTGTATVQLGLSLQNASTTVAGDVSADETEKSLELGKTYRFTAYVESVSAGEFFQFTLRNIANGGLKDFEISNVSFVYESEAAKTGGYVFEKLAFGEPVGTVVTPEAGATEAILPENKYGYAA